MPTANFGLYSAPSKRAIEFIWTINDVTGKVHSGFQVTRLHRHVTARALEDGFERELLVFEVGNPCKAA